MFYVSYLKKKISRIRLYQDKVCVGVLYSTSARNLEENKLLQSSLWKHNLAELNNPIVVSDLLDLSEHFNY